MEAQNKEKTAKTKNKKKFSFGNLKIKNKIIFGFFVVSIISGLANYYSNTFIVNEFQRVNVTMHVFHEIFAMQKKLEIMVEKFVSDETTDDIQDYEFNALHNRIDIEFEGFIRTGGEFIEKSLMSRFINKSGEFYEKESELISVHKREINARNIVIKLQASEKEKRYEIRNYIENLSNSGMYTAFLYSEYQSKEMLYQYKDDDHAKEWLESLNKVREMAQKKSIDIPEIDDYIGIASSTSESVSSLNAIKKEEENIIREFRLSIENLNTIQDEVSRAITDQNIKEINNIIILGVFVFIFISIFFTIAFGYIISGFISRPIKELADFSLVVGKGNLQRRMIVNTNDEIGQTAKAFNVMLDKITESTAILEVKVNARTKRLEELSRDLEVQVDGKTRELNEKIRELERFNDLAVGRELRMVELKRENEMLRQGSGLNMTKKMNKAKKITSTDNINCWDFWNCREEIRDKCPAYLSNMGRECWIISAGKCPRSKQKGFVSCKECAWYKKMNK